MNTGIPIIISAPSGAGKTTLIKLLMKKVRGLSYSVSATTRPPSKKEKNGRDYFFISEKEFLQRKKANEFIETARVHGHYYGTLKKQLDQKLKTGKDRELWLTDAVGQLARQGKVIVHTIEGKWLTTGDPLNLLRATLKYASDREDLKKMIKEFSKDL